MDFKKKQTLREWCQNTFYDKGTTDVPQRLKAQKASTLKSAEAFFYMARRGRFELPAF